MKAFVTGGNGFLGSHLIDQLLDKGWTVHALVRRGSNLRWLTDGRIHLHFGDITTDLAGLREGLQGADVCFHLAGIIDAPSRKGYDRVNVGGTTQVLEAVLKVNPKIRKVVVVTSLAALGPSMDGRLPTEQDNCHPLTDYGKSKRGAELVALSYKTRLPITIIRPPAIYGPRDLRTFQFFRMARRGFILLPGTRKTRLNLVHVQDVVQGIILAAERPSSSGEIFFIGDKDHYSWEEIASITEAAVHKPVQQIRVPVWLLHLGRGISRLLTLLTGKTFSLSSANLNNFIQPYWTLDIGKSEKGLGYKPEYPLKKGVEETILWYRNQHWM